MTVWSLPGENRNGETGGARVSAVLFDFDYTLADSSKGVVECVNHALAGEGRPPLPEASIRRTIGLSLTETYAALTADRDPGRASEFSRRFVERAEEVMVDGTVVFDTVGATVDRLRRRGLALGVVSTKYRRRIETILQRDGLDGLFDVIIGGEDVATLKPDPEGLLLAAERLRTPVSETLFVGDSIVDAEAARRAGMPFAAVLSGVTPREEFSSRDVEWILDSIADL